MPRGFTLVEMLVTLALLGVVAGVAAVQLRPPARPALPSGLDSLNAARRRALATGRAVTITILADSVVPRLATALPDGRVIVESGMAVNLFTGRPDAAR